MTVPSIPYWFYLSMLLPGLIVMMFGRSLLKKLVGLCLVQSAALLFYILAKPFSIIFILTVAITGVCTALVSSWLLRMVRRRYQTLDEDKILELMQ